MNVILNNNKRFNSDLLFEWLISTKTGIETPCTGARSLYVYTMIAMICSSIPFNHTIKFSFLTQLFFNKK